MKAGAAPGREPGRGTGEDRETARVKAGHGPGEGQGTVRTQAEGRHGRKARSRRMPRAAAQATGSPSSFQAAAAAPISPASVPVRAGASSRPWTKESVA